MNGEWGALFDGLHLTRCLLKSIWCGMKRLPIQTRICIQCGGKTTRRRWKNGQLESGFKKRKFCSIKCFGINQMKENPTPNAARRRAQRIYEAKKCSLCNSQSRVQRHHKDRNPCNNTKKNILIVCQSCHVKEHNKTGTWGKRRMNKKKCVICLETFQPRKSRDKLCRNKNCLSVLGKLSAELRWGKKTTK